MKSTAICIVALALMLSGCLWERKEPPAAEMGPPAPEKRTHAKAEPASPAGAGASAAVAAPAAASPVAEAQTRDARVFAAPFDRVWAAVIATLAAMKLPVESMEQEAGLVSTTFVSFEGARASSELARVSTKPPKAAPAWTKARYSLNVFVTPGGAARTNVSVTAHVEGYANPDGWRLCYSNGVLEKKFFDGVASRIGGR